MYIVFLEKLIVSHLAKKFAPVYGNQRFITVSKRPTSLPYPETDERG
jgi:hypothetical protein